MSGLWTPGSGDPAATAAPADRSPARSRPSRRRRRPSRPPEEVAARPRAARHASRPRRSTTSSSTTRSGSGSSRSCTSASSPRPTSRAACPRPTSRRPARDRRPGRAGRRARRSARRGRADAARRARPGADAVRRGRRRPARRTGVRSVIEPVVLTGHHVRLEPLDARARAGARRGRIRRPRRPTTGRRSPTARPRTGATWKRCSRSTRPGAGSALRRSGWTRTDQQAIESSARRRTSIRSTGPAAAGTLDSIEIGSTWLGASAQRTIVNAEAKLLDARARVRPAARAPRGAQHRRARNERSRTAIARIGATFEGVLHSYRYGVEGTPRDTATFAIPAREWPEVRARLEARLSR